MTFGSAAAGWFLPGFFLSPAPCDHRHEIERARETFSSCAVSCVLSLCVLLVIVEKVNERVASFFSFLLKKKKTEKEISFRIGYLSPSDIFN